MKLSEFEEKLTTVSERKLRLMLEEGRRNGPEVAVDLILAEAARRGLDLEGGAAPAEPAEPADIPLEGFEPAPSRMDGTHGFEDAPDEDGERTVADGAAATGEEAPAFSEADGEGSTANKGAWLAEETSGGGMSGVAKALIALAVLAGAAGAVYYFVLKG